MMRLKSIAIAAALLAVPAAAQEPDFSAFDTGPVFADFGPHAAVDGAGAIAPDAEFRIAFDVADKADEGAKNRGFESAARFINMHVAAGVPEGNIDIAVVVHGKAVLDLVTEQARETREIEANASGAMVRAMVAQGVRFIVCGQSAQVWGVQSDDLIEGVELDLSAMTAHAQLQQRGYTVNPF
ncbi:hypothetical protein MTsPCn3_07840 [Erythrobacter sp. MTPC3]